MQVIIMENIDFSKIYSYSKLSLFNKCKKQYYFEYLDPKIAQIKKQFRKPRDYKTKGQAVHGAITLFYHLPLEKRAFENLKDCLRRAWFSEIDPFKNPPLGETGGFGSLEHERKTYYDALRILRNFFSLGEIEPKIFYLPTDKIRNSFDDYKNFIKPVDDDLSISGKIDRIDELEDEGLRIIDFKTGKEDKDQFQLDFYKLLAELNFDNKVKVVSFYHLDMGKIKDFDVLDTDQNKIRNQVLEKIKIIRNARNFPPEPSGLCEHCDFLEICPARRK